jgi:NAD+ kinase
MTSPATPNYGRIAFVASPIPEAEEALARLADRYGSVVPEQADVIVALGGDGFMLQTLHRFMSSGKPIYGMNRGTVGFLMNEFQLDGLRERLAAARTAVIHPLLMHARAADGSTREFHAFNEVSLFRQTYQAARLRILIDGKERLAELVADGVLLATPAGSTAYNFSAHGPILPLGSQLLAITPISPFRPRRWRGAILPAITEIRIDILDPYKRPVSATADSNEVRDVVEVRIRESREQTMTLLFDPEHNLEERILNEQFEL